MTTLDALHCLLAILAGGALFTSVVSRWPDSERKVAMYSWYAHVVSAFATIAVFKYYYGYGDIIGYFRYGKAIAAYVEYDMVNHLPQVISLLFQQESELPIEIIGAGSATGSMVALASLLGLVTTSLWAGSILVATLAALGQAWMWLGVKALVPSEAGKRALVSVFLVPSVVFWSSSMFKEAFALIGMGLAVFGAARLVSGEAGRGGLSLSLGVITVGLSKAYVLFPLAITAGIYAYWTRAASRGGVRLRPTRLLGGVAAIVVMLVLLGKLFPNYAVDSVAETINQQQEASLSVQGGSDFRLGESDTPRERGALGLLKDMPFTIATALLRPLFFEARSAMVLINSLETSVFLYLLITAFGRTGRVELARWVWRTPAIMASIVFVFVFSAAVGLATTNLGALSRYRLPMMPFYAYVVLSAYALPSRQSGRGLSQRSSSGGDVLAAELPHRRRAI